MAKLTARGCTVLVQLEVTREDSRTKFALRSDGAVLRNWWIVDRWDGWKIFGRITDPAKRTEETLRRHLARNGYTVTKKL